MAVGGSGPGRCGWSLGRVEERMSLLLSLLTCAHTTPPSTSHDHAIDTPSTSDSHRGCSCQRGCGHDACCRASFGAFEGST
eukprot:2440232-Rhodomonas_salina.3